MRVLAGAFGAGVLAGALVVAVATALDGIDDPTGRGGLVVLAGALLVLVAVSGVMGVFGRELALIAVALGGVWTAWMAALVVRVVTDESADLLAGAVVVLAACVGGFVVAWVAWFVGTIVCVSTGHFTSRELSEIAYGRTGRAADGGGSVYDDVLDELVRRHAGGERVTARSMGIERRSTWHRPVAILATDRRLVMAPMDTDGALGDDSLSVPAHDVSVASVASLHRDGSVRRALSSHDDVIEISTVDGRRCRFVLAYEAKRRAGSASPSIVAPEQVAGADGIRHWIRTHATTYR